MRLALAAAAPAFFITTPIATPLMPLIALESGGLLVSATSTSPLGNTYSQRG